MLTKFKKKIIIKNGKAFSLANRKNDYAKENSNSLIFFN